MVDNITRELYVGDATGFFEKDNFIGLMKKLRADGTDTRGSISSYMVDGVRVEYCLHYRMSGPDRTTVKLTGDQQLVGQLEKIIEKEKESFGKKK